MLRHDMGPLVPYILALVLACPGNNTCQLFSEVSRWARQARIALDAGLPPPPPPDAQLHALMVNEYVTKYNLKPEATTADHAFLRTAHYV
jgi:hypothetical protein